jgi:hypothetical protein
MSVINTNITSMIGQQNLNKSQNALQTSMERLSSGLRINSAKLLPTACLRRSLVWHRRSVMPTTVFLLPKPLKAH